MAHRIEGERLECIDLFSHAHRAQLGGDIGANASGQGKTGEYRGEFEGDRFLDQRAHEIRRHEIAHGIAGEERQYDPGEQGNEDADRQ